EFQKYQISVSAGSGAGAAGGKRLPPVVRSREEPTSCSFEGLEPGAHYAVAVKTMSGKVTSWPATTEVTLKPLAVRELRWERSTAAGEEGRLRVWWTPPDGSTQDEYEVSYHEEGEGGADDGSTLTTPTSDVTLDALLPGVEYTITVSAVSRGVKGEGVSVMAATRPLAPVLRASQAEPPPRSDSGDDSERRSLLLTFSSDVNSRQDLYHLRYRRYRPNNTDDEPFKTLETNETSVALEDLYPGAVYELQLAAISHGLRSDTHSLLQPVHPLQFEDKSEEEGVAEVPADASVRNVSAAEGGGRAVLGALTPGWGYGVAVTAHAYNLTSDVFTMHTRTLPRPIRSLNATAVGARSVSLAWERPRGDFTDFELQYLAAPDHLETMATPAFRATLQDLHPYTLYTFTVEVCAKLFGKLSNGNVTAYTLVLGEEPRNDTPARLPSWRDVHRLPVWPPYQVTEPYYPFHSSAVEEFTIGSERCEGGGRAYCNGPLKPNT
ncbi:unnamed protein product, partial [Leptidea sinapis]